MSKQVRWYVTSRSGISSPWWALVLSILKCMFYSRSIDYLAQIIMIKSANENMKTWHFHVAVKVMAVCWVFTARRSNASDMLGVVVLSVRPSHAYFVKKKQTMHCGYFYTTRNRITRLFCRKTFPCQKFHDILSTAFWVILQTHGQTNRNRSTNHIIHPT